MFRAAIVCQNPHSFDGKNFSALYLKTGVKMPNYRQGGLDCGNQNYWRNRRPGVEFFALQRRIQPDRSGKRSQSSKINSLDGCRVARARRKNRSKGREANSSNLLARRLMREVDCV
jgi:hypothetical protein